MLHELLAKFRPDPLRARVEASVQRGTGLHKGEWLRDALPLTQEQLAEVSEEIVAWCRERMAASRKPYGIDQMALAVACAEPGGVPLASKTFGVFRPVDFYEAEGVAERVTEFVRGLDLEAVNALQGGVRFAAALFSWGDVAREAIYNEEDEATTR
jgi:hypothetical protein